MAEYLGDFDKQVSKKSPLARFQYETSLDNRADQAKGKEKMFHFCAGSLSIILSHI